MRLFTAIKAFFKALKDPQSATNYLAKDEHKSLAPPIDTDPSHLRLLGILQRTGRLIDFLQEDISGFDDAQVGAAVRKIHQDCQKVLNDVVAIRPLMDEPEGAKIEVAAGYDPSAIKLVGSIPNHPPFKGILVHRGWKAHKKSLPKKTDQHLDEIIQPAEIEISTKGN